MTNYKPGDIVLIDLPFTDETTYKQRPALVLIDQKDDDIVLARITSIIRPNQSYDFEIKDLASAGLNTKSFIRLTKIFTIEKTKVKHILGTLSPKDTKAINQLMQKIFKL